MSAPFAIVRTGGEPPALETLEAAIRGVPGLTPYDARSRCDGHGIIVRGLSAEQAAVFETNLKAAGVIVECVEEARLPVLPPGKIIRQVEFTAEALMILDLVGRKTPVNWKQIKLFAAGSVQLTTFSRSRQEGAWGAEIVHVVHVGGLGALPALLQDSGPNYTVKESSDWFLRAEIVLADGATRYSFEAEKFQFTCLGERMTKNLAGDFCQFVRELAGRATSAALNRGAAAIVGEPPAFVYYPRKGMFHEEMIWMLWRAVEGRVS